jgi:hypothetical protein
MACSMLKSLVLTDRICTGRLRAFVWSVIELC